MNSPSLNQRLCNITTLWSLVINAHEGPAEAARAAQQQLLERYGGAIRRYLLASLRDEEFADELYNEFAYRFVRGDYRNVNPERGRFRDYVKTVVAHLISSHQKQRRRLPQSLEQDHAEPAVEGSLNLEDDQAFLESWRKELLARAWANLERDQAVSGQPYYTVLRFRSDNPTAPSPQVAEGLSAQLGRPVTAAGARQMLHRAREKFADILVEEVAHSLKNATAEQLAQELMDIGLYQHCRVALERREGERGA